LRIGSSNVFQLPKDHTIDVVDATLEPPSHETSNKEATPFQAEAQQHEQVLEMVQAKSDTSF